MAEKQGSEMELQPPKKGVHLIGGHKPDAPDLSGIRGDLNSLSARIRLLEEGFANLRRMSQITEENLISKGKHYNTEIKAINSDLSELHKEMRDVKDKVMLIIKELQSTAKKEDVKVLEKYISLWNPLKFITHEEAEKIVNEVLAKNEP